MADVFKINPKVGTYTKTGTYQTRPASSLSPGDIFNTPQAPIKEMRKLGPAQGGKSQLVVHKDKDRVYTVPLKVYDISKSSENDVAGVNVIGHV